MELINQHTKAIMEGCKERARTAGLKFQDETLEYIVTNRDLLELSPKVMIPTLYDYWVHDVEVLKEKGRYELYPNNPYETVINTRPAISFYNDNNPDWLNVMIFYHVLAHIDFFQNNFFFQNTWEYDFTGRALSDKRGIAKLRSEKGHWVDYVIEFSRGIDNLVGYFDALCRIDGSCGTRQISRFDYYFDVFLQSEKKVNVSKYIKEVNRYNDSTKEYGSGGEVHFFADVKRDYPEFEALYQKHREEKPEGKKDLLQFLLVHSAFLKKNENQWMKSIMEVVRNTSLFFQPQIRTKILNEGWASYWHETLFLKDDRIGGHEVDFARVNAKVTAMPRVGLNPYAMGMRLFHYIEEKGDKGKFSIEFERILNAEKRKEYDGKTGSGRHLIFKVREDLCDFTFINSFLDEDFVTQNKLFVTGRRLNRSKGIWEYYVKSRKPEDYRQMVLESLYHPPHVQVDLKKTVDGNLYLNHKFEGKPLVKDFIANTMMGIEYLWGGPVHLETSEVVAVPQERNTYPLPLLKKLPMEDDPEKETEWKRVRYTMKDRKLAKEIIS